MASGSEHSLVLTGRRIPLIVIDDSVSTWLLSDFGLRVATCGDCCNVRFVRAEGGELWAWGWNEHGNVGVGAKVECVREPRRILLPSPGKSDESSRDLPANADADRAQTPSHIVRAVVVGAAHTIAIATLPDSEELTSVRNQWMMQNLL